MCIAWKGCRRNDLRVTSVERDVKSILTHSYSCKPVDCLRIDDDVESVGQMTRAWRCLYLCVCGAFKGVCRKIIRQRQFSILCARNTKASTDVWPTDTAPVTSSATRSSWSLKVGKLLQVLASWSSNFAYTDFSQTFVRNKSVVITST